MRERPPRRPILAIDLMPNTIPTVSCAICGKVHPLQEAELAYGLPDEIFELDTDTRAKRAYTSPDICVLDDSRRFLRALLPLPVEGRERPYRIGVWVEIDPQQFREIRALWADENQAAHPPFKAVLANEIRRCPGSRGLPLEVHLTGPKTRPECYIVDSTHTLFHQQTGGISEHSALEYSE